MKNTSYDEKLLMFYLDYYTNNKTIPKATKTSFKASSEYITKGRLIKLINEGKYISNFRPNQVSNRIMIELWNYLPKRPGLRNYFEYTPDFRFSSKQGEIWIECKNNCGYIGKFKKSPYFWNFKKRFVHGYCNMMGIEFIELRWNQPYKTWDNFTDNYAARINTKTLIPVDTRVALINEKKSGRRNKWNYTRICEPFNIASFVKEID